MKINENNDMSMHTDAKSLEIADIDSDVFDLSKVFRYGEFLYERLIDKDEDDVQYRVILNVDDYDYVEDQDLIATLNTIQI